MSPHPNDTSAERNLTNAIAESLLTAQPVNGEALTREDAQRLAVLAEAAAVTVLAARVDEERLVDDTGEPADVGYNQAIDAALRAIRSTRL